MLNIVFLGAPGSGKGTQASILSSQLNIPTISTGDILRSEVTQESEIGILAKKYMNEGGLVPDEVVINIIKKRILKEDCDNGFILDGFPRTISQAIALEENLSHINKSISSVISLDVPDDIIIKRISGRFSCSDCSTLYNRFFSNVKKEGICDVCESRNLFSRADDNQEAVTNRLKIYHRNTKELIDFYEKKDLIYKVNGLKTVDLVKRDIEEAIRMSSKKAKHLLNL